MRQIMYFFILISLTMFLLTPNLTAAKIGGEALTISYQVNNSDRIIIGTVSGIDTYSNYTIYTIKVNEWLYNPLPSDSVKVISNSGTREMEDQVKFTHLNESSLLMLNDENIDKQIFRVFVGNPGKHQVSDRDTVIKELKSQGKWLKGNIDTSTNNVTSTVKVGNYSEVISVISDGKKVYMTNLGGHVADIGDGNKGTVCIFDRENNSYIASLPVGKWPWSVAVNPDITKVYLTNNGTVSVIDITNKTDSHINSEGEWTWAVALNPNGSKAYVADSSRKNLSVIDMVTKNVTTMNFGFFPSPFGVTIIPDGKKIYVTASIGNIPVIDTATNTITSTVDAEVNAVEVAVVSKDGKKVYVANSDSDEVFVIDTSTDKVTARVPVGSAEKIAINPNEKQVYVLNSRSDNVSIIDTSTNKVTASVPIKNLLPGIAIKPDGTKVYVANYSISKDGNVSNSTISVIDTATNKITTMVPVGDVPIGIAVCPDGSKLYVVNVGSNDINKNLSNGSVSVIDTATNTVTAIVPVRILPKLIALNSDGSKAYVVNYGYFFIENSSVSVIDTAKNTVTATVMDIGIDPQGIAISSDGSKVYVASYADINSEIGDVIEGQINNGIVSIIDTATNTVIAKMKVGKNPVSIAITPDGTKVYVANNGDETVSVIDTATNNVTATVPLRSPVAFGKFIISFVPQSAIEKRTPLVINETRITTSGSAGAPEIYEDRVVYIDSNHTWDVYMYNQSTDNETLIGTSEQACSPKIEGDRMVMCTDHMDVYMYNLSTHNETQISTRGQVSNNIIYGDRIVWTEKGGSPGLYMYNLSTSKETQITANKSARFPAIYDTKIVWNQDNQKGGHDFYVYDLSTSKETRIKTKESADDSVPYINNYPEYYGDRVVWLDEHDVDGHTVNDVYMFNLSTSKETRITTRNSSKTSPNIYGDNIVWYDYHNENEVNSQRNLSNETTVWVDDCNEKRGIYTYNITTSKETQITTNDQSVRELAMYGDRIVWSDDHNHYYDSISNKLFSTDIYMYDLSTSKETRITTSGSAEMPYIYGDKIVWQDRQKRNSNIYIATLR